jgi:exopolyphosphatase/pppGpp-phosphohydrolase
LKQFHDTHHVQVFFPSESTEQSFVLLVFDPTSLSASSSLTEKERHLEEVSKELLKLAKDAADVKSETISVDKRWHDAVVGKGGTTLNA